MAGSITIGGSASGIGGRIDWGPNTATGTRGNPTVIDVELEAKVEKAVALPPEARHWAAAFEYAGTEPPTIKVKTNLNKEDEGFPFPAQAFASMPVGSGVKELIFEASTAPKAFQLFVIS